MANYGQIKPPLGAGLNRSHNLTNGLIDCFLFNENAGSTAINVARTQSQLTSVGSASYPIFGNGGINNTAYPSSGKDGMYEVSSSARSFSSFTAYILAAGNPANISGRYPCLMSITGTTNALILGPNIGANIRLYAFGGSVQAIVNPTSIAGSYANTMCVFSFDAVAKIAYIYTNGQLLYHQVGYGSYSYSGSDYLCIGGRYNNSVNTAWNGTIYTAGLYNRLLSASEIASLSAAPYQMFGYAPDRYYSFGGIFVPRSIGGTRRMEFVR